MASFRQVALVGAGSSPWHPSLVSSPGCNRFAYAATLAVYIYQADSWDTEEDGTERNFSLSSVVCPGSHGHSGVVCSLAWHPKGHDVLAIGTRNPPQVLLWDTELKEAVSCLEVSPCVPTVMAWAPESDSLVLMECRSRGAFLWGPRGKRVRHWKDLELPSPVLCLARREDRIAFGHPDGTVSVFGPGDCFERHLSAKNDFKEGEVMCLDWDPRSSSYLLVLVGGHRLHLLDVECKTIVGTYLAPSKALTLSTMTWHPSAPGLFLTGDECSGVLRLWGVSQQPSPLENIRLKESGFLALCPLAGSERIVALFRDGGVGVYHLGKKIWLFLREMGHTETIFDCQFSPGTGDRLATGSYDGTIKIWDSSSMDPVWSTTGQESVIYSLSWSPSGRWLVAGTSKRGILFWDTKRRVLAKRLMEHGAAVSVYSVAWNQKDGRRLATAGADGACVVHNVRDVGSSQVKLKDDMEPEVLFTFQHPGFVFGCDWHPTNETILCTACDDSLIRVFSATQGNTQPIKVLRGHEAKVFRVRWNPLMDNQLASTSDDNTCRVWDYGKEEAIAVLKGHTACVRGLAWNPELPNVIATGSWDASLRLWDIRTCCCIAIAADHAADVYGLSCHPSRPFLLASTSRDSTLRLWSLGFLASMHHVRALLLGCPRPARHGEEIAEEREGESEVVEKNEESISDPERLWPELEQLKGSASKSLRRHVVLNGDKSLDVEDHLQLAALLQAKAGNLLDLVNAATRSEAEFSYSEDYKASDAILKRSHVSQVQQSRAQQLEARQSPVWAGIRTQAKDEHLKEVARLYLLLGQMDKYCHLMMQTGQWLEALCMAPAVSQDFWKECLNRYIGRLLGQESPPMTVAPYLVAAGAKDQLVRLLRQSKQFQEALTVAATASESDQTNGPDLYSECAKDLAEMSSREGAPTRASCYCLAAGDVEGCIRALVRGHELQLALSVSTALGFKGAVFGAAIKYTALSCTATGHWETALELVLRLRPHDEVGVMRVSEDLELFLVQLMASCPLSLPERNKLHSMAGIPCVEDCDQQAKSCIGQERIKYLLLSSQPRDALMEGIRQTREILSRGDWTLVEVWDLIQMMSYMRDAAQLVSSETLNKQVKEMQLYSAYLGALAAMALRYDSVVPLLFHKARVLLQDMRDPVLPLTEEQIVSESEAAKDRFCGLKGDDKIVMCDLECRLKGWSVTGDYGETRVTGGHLPRHSDARRCCITNRPIQGPVFILEDGKSAMSLDHALMWAKVNAFSPLGTGNRINPF